MQDYDQNLHYFAGNMTSLQQKKIPALGFDRQSEQAIAFFLHSTVQFTVYNEFPKSVM